MQAHAPHAQGSEAYNRLAALPLRSAATLVDLCLAGALFFAALAATGAVPVPGLAWLAGWVGIYAATWLAQKAAFGLTLGERCWQLKAGYAGLRAPLYQFQKVEPRSAAVGSFLTTLTIVLAVFSMNRAVIHHPLWTRAENIELEAFLPDMKAGAWEILPYYYSLGAWPAQYRGKPVFHLIPYEKGPPTRFPGRIQALWDDTLGTRVTFEGPKTPVENSRQKHSREKIRACIRTGALDPDCLRIRNTTLSRHFKEMQRALVSSTREPIEWTLRWFEVKNAGLPPMERAQGVFVSAQTETRGQQRYILMTENGTHQAFILEYSTSEPAEASRQLFSQAIRSLRASDNLNPGRAWIDRQLQGIRLGGAKAQAGLRADQIASAQSALIAKISVDPRTFDSYFHLGGTALLLKQMLDAEGPSAPIELKSVARGLAQSAYRFGEDVAPRDVAGKPDGRVSQLHGFWLETQKN